ncbi:aspartate/glutamate racemase family protein [Paenibacillus puerhi]|uniref:aspartate/glutamate racemase family protein n=1 Tax=Paenibacillus puerhi TaxID=2692622 RepID=UPI00135C1ABD|nr:aspartate/glutamate racemase family protein [Paenibacillus puerhi]
MKTIVAVFTGQGLAEPLKAIVQELLPDCRLVNIIDDSLIGDVVRAGEVPPGVARRLVQYFHHAEEIGADVILNTCSSVGEIADEARRFIGVPIVKIDDAMTAAAAAGYERIGVLATLSSTLEPTMRLVRRQAGLAGREVTLLSGLAEGAFDELVSGNPAGHDRILLETAQRIAEEADVLVLAQGSMARMEAKLREATGKPVLSSPRMGVEAVKAVLEEQERTATAVSATSAPSAAQGKGETG